MFQGFHDPNLKITSQHMIFMIYWIILDSLRASISLPIGAPTNVSVFCMATLFRQLRSNHSSHSHSWRSKYATGTFCFTTTVARPITNKNCLGQGCFSCRNFLCLHHFWLVTSLFHLGKKEAASILSTASFLARLVCFTQVDATAMLSQSWSKCIQEQVRRVAIRIHFILAALYLPSCSRFSCVRPSPNLFRCHLIRVIGL
jgi:hypothetical protein